MNINVKHLITPPSLSNGESTEMLCDENGNLKVAIVSGGGGSGGDASAAKQDQQTALLTTIDADTSSLVAKDFATSANQDEQTILLTGIDDSLNNPLTINLPSGAATSALQTSGNASLTSIDSKLPVLGQALAADSIPVVLTSSQLTSLTPPGNAGYATSALQVTGNASLASVDAKLTSPLTINLPTGASTSANQITANASLSSIDGKLTSPLTINLPTGASTAANQTSGNASLTSIDSKTPALGQALAAASVPVVLTSAQLTTLTPPAAITGFATETTLVSLNSKVTAVNTGAVVISSSALPTGASTSALQTSGNASLTSIDSNLGTIRSNTPPLGQALMAASTPVVIASNQSTLPISAASLPLPTGAATETTLASLNSKVTAVNTGAVVISSSALPTGAATETTLSALNNKFTAVALADGVANPTVSSTGSYTMVFDGTNWNRMKAGITTVAANIGGMINVLPMGRYNGTSPVSLSTGDSAILQMNTRGHLKVVNQIGEVQVFRNEGANATLNIKASAGRIYGFDCRNANASVRFLQFWNTATVAGTGILLMQFAIPASTSRTLSSEAFTSDGIAFSTGLAFGYSTTSGTYTAGTASEQTTQVLYV